MRIVAGRAADSVERGQEIGDESDVARAALDAEISVSDEGKPTVNKGSRTRMKRAGRPGAPKTFGSRAR